MRNTEKLQEPLGSVKYSTTTTFTRSVYITLFLLSQEIKVLGDH